MPHMHLMVRAEIKYPLRTEAAAKQFLRDAVALAGMNIIDGPHAVIGAVPGNEGVSAVAILDFSSAAVHEWPDCDPALLQFDLYTCGTAEPTPRLFWPVFDRLGLLTFSAILIDRDLMLVTEART